ncbi:MAG: hypothetical protein PHI37_03960 [Candidatus Gracilibacteria bacterium]|nr:hypothetical protein [Candidatus Gracilibacteria bacterium]
MFFNAELAYSSFSAYENQISEESNEIKVKKLQEVFSGLGLYNGVIDGNFSSVKDSLLSYQKKAGIIIEDDDHGAGYFGNKTIEALERDFGDRFLQLKETYLKIDEPSKEERYFYVTAYYSPLPGQERYLKGNYEAEIRLNGKGIKGASGKEVFPGMIAAPRNYAFGTKIYLDGVGIGSVEDRGGAIVNSGERGHEYDRLDIWMGYGDEGLQRALKWGTRKVKGKVLEGNREVTIEFNSSPIVKYKGLVVDAEKPVDTSVKDLQSLLKEIGLYNGDIDGNYEKVKNILIKYQIENGVIENEYDEAAGYFGEKTYAAIRKQFGIVGDDLFIYKYIESGAISELSIIEKNNLEIVKVQLEKLLSKKYNGDTIKIKKFKNTLKTTIDKTVDTINNSKKKSELIYFRDIL